jgi:hypothetical protein
VPKINSKVKGAVGERELAAELNRLLSVSTRRGQQFSGLEGEDVVGLPGIHIECKRVEKLNIETAINQSIKDAKPDQVPAVFHRKNRKPWLVTFLLEDINKFVSAINDLSAEVDSGTVITNMKQELAELKAQNDSLAAELAKYKN